MKTVMWRFRNDWEIKMYRVKSIKEAEAMVIQLKSNPEIEYAIISDEVAL